MRLPWFLQGPKAQLIEQFADQFWRKTNQAWFKALKQRFSIESTPTALELQAKQLNIFVQNLNQQERKNLLARKQQILGKLGTASILNSAMFVFDLEVWRVEVMRGHLMSGKYPLAALRFWYRPKNNQQDAGLELRIQQLLRFLLPAKNTKHFQLVYQFSNKGFASNPFGGGFGQ